jgi:DNA-binding protein YbaB
MGSLFRIIPTWVPPAKWGPTVGRYVAEDDEDASRPPLADVSGSGTAANGGVTVVVSVDGERDAVTFDPRVMRLSSEVLAGFVRDAMRDAHKAMFEQLTERGANSVGDLTKRVEEMQVAYTTRMRSYERIIADIEIQLRNGYQ